MRQIPFSLDHINLSTHSTKDITDTLEEFAIEIFFEDESGDLSRFNALIKAHTALTIHQLEEDDIDEHPFLDPKEACAYVARLCHYYTGSYEESFSIGVDIHKPLLNRMRATMNYLREQHSKTGV